MSGTHSEIRVQSVHLDSAKRGSKLFGQAAARLESMAGLPTTLASYTVVVAGFLRCRLTDLLKIPATVLERSRHKK